MTKCYQEKIEFPSCKRRKVEVNFAGGDITSDGGSLLLREADRKLKLTSKVSREITDTRDSKKRHSLLSMLRQRIYGLCLGYSDLNDHDTLRHDIGFQTAVEKEDALASSPTLCRFENKANKEAAWAINRIMVEVFLRSFKNPPKEIVLDFDATDDAVHGKQESRFFHGYYDHYCFLPLYVFCGDQLLVSYLRPSKIDGAKHAWAILSLLVKRIRQEWPKTEIVFRADSGFCRWRLLSWCERNHVKYIVGIARNAVLEKLSQEAMNEAYKRYQETGKKVRYFSDVYYAAKTWNKKRRVLVKSEMTLQGKNPRFVVTNLSGDAAILYDKLYVMRGDTENRIKEQQLHLFADRTSCHKWWANQFRLLLSSLAYVLLESVRRLALKGTELAKAQCQTIRLKLLKIGAVVLKNTRRVCFKLSSAYPYQNLFLKVAHRLSTG